MTRYDSLRCSGAIHTPNELSLLSFRVPKRMQINRRENPVETVFDARAIPFPRRKVLFYKCQ